jgi:hypothetical protein
MRASPSKFAEGQPGAAASFGGEGRVVRFFAAAVLAAVCVFPTAVGASPCQLASGEAVTLRSSYFDPDVLVWDTRQRAVDYVNGNIKSASEVLPHTVLSRSGTRAIVVACDPATSQPRYSPVPLDTVGIKITNGPNRGRYGWVSSGDAHAGATARWTDP